MSHHDYREPPSMAVELSGRELQSLTCVDEVLRLLRVLYRPKARPRQKLEADDYDGQKMELETHLSVLDELGDRLAKLRLTSMLTGTGAANSDIQAGR